MEHLQKGYLAEAKKQGSILTKEQALAKAWTQLGNDVYKQTYTTVGNIEKSRKIELPHEFYERDARVVLAKYATDVAKRIAYVEKFGAKGEIAELRFNTLNKLAKETGADFKTKNILNQEKALLEQLFSSHTGLIEVDPIKNWGNARARTFLKNAVDFEVTTKIGLGYATVPNVTQTLISTMVRAGVWNTFKGTHKLVFDKKFKKAI